MWYKAVSLWVWTALTVLVPAQSSPPVITDFLQRDLVYPEDVKAGAQTGFRLPCKATGSNLKWTWKHNGTTIAAYDGRPFTLTGDGTLIGSSLTATDSGTYQCLVGDEKTGAVAFSRKLKVAVTAVGAFINPTSVVKNVNLGDPFSYDCPPHEYSYGVVYSWGNVDGDAHHTFARNERRSISSNGTLFIMYLTQEDIDEIKRYKGIRCTISGANSFQRSGTLKLEKIDKDQKDSENSTLPIWFVTPSAQETAVQGRNKTLFCFASGRPSPKITWKKDGKRIRLEESSFKISQSFHGRRLSIQNVDKELHEGTYTCEAQNDLNEETPISFNFTLNVEVPPQWAADAPPKNITIVSEKNGTLECKVTASPPAEVSWYKNGKLLQPSERHILDGSSLHLIDVSLNDSGVYQCVAVNVHGMIISATWINVAAWKPSFANVQFGPFHLLNKKEAKLPCKPSTAAPAPTYEWLKNDELITYDEDSRYRLEMDGTLVIKEVDKDQDNVNYTCKAKNFKGEDSVTTVPIIRVLPRLTTEPINQTITEGAMATFYCTASGHPNPKITWINDEKIVTTGDTLSFKTSRNHSGEYWCSAENGLNVTVKASASLNVLYKPSLTTVPTNQTIIEDAMTTLNCVATGNPKPKVTWIRDGKIVTTGNTLTLQAKKDLSGKYWCSADNGLNSTVNASAYLDVLFPPSLNITPSDQTIMENEEVTFHCTATGNPTPDITWLKDGKTVGMGDTLSFKAKSEKSGKYWCSADNGLDTTVNTSASLDVQFAPSLITTPTDQTVLESETATFHCNATGNPTPTITWIKDGQTVAKGNTMSFKANRTRSGKYWCSAENGLNSTANASANLDVKFPPSLIRKPSDQTIIEGQELKFYCIATGNPAPTITWTKDGKTEAEGDTLNFKANRSNSGNYWCSAENGLGISVNSSAYLDVQFAPSLITTPADQTVLESATATFHCNATGNPTPKIKWVKDGKTVALGDTFVIEGNKNHSGKYWCLAENGLNVTVNASANLDVQFSPSINVRPTDKTVTEGDVAAFHCNATGNPNPKITWLKDGKTVVTGETLRFIARRNQSGKYWCSADNGFNNTVNASADLDVQFPPGFTTIPINQTVNEDDQTIFHCAATGNPTPRITWIKDGETVGEGDPLSFNTKRNHSGKYWCSAENGLGPAINTSAHLDVQFAPGLTTLPTNQTVLEGNTATFLCHAAGNPTPTITWIKDERVVGTGKTLTIETRKESSGEYLCVADNGLSGTVNASAYLDVQFPPSFVDVPLDQTVRENDETSFYCSATGNPTPTITWLLDGMTVASGKTFKFVANRTQSGQYWCSVENGLNVRINASAQLDVQYSPSFILKPTNETVTEGDLAIFSCDATGNPAPKITWIKDGEAVDGGDTLSFEAFRNQSGEYWCLAENGLNDPVNTSAYLDVQFPPSFTTTPIDQTVQEGNGATFHCRATGNPTPTITWLKDGKTVGQGDTLNMKVSRNHTGKYWCTADNGLDVNINASALLDVQFSPSLITRPANKTVVEGDQATFHCEATGNPTPTIKWIRDGKTVVTGETLTFETKRNDSGKYWCLTDNGLNSTANASAYLDVQFPVSFTSTPVDQTVTEGDETTFHCTATGHPTPVITWLKDGKTVASGENLTFTANRNRSGQYLCSAENGLGVAITATADLDVQYAPRLFTVPSNMTVIEGAMATFHCNATGNPTARYRWIKDGKTVVTGNTLSFQTNRNHSGRYWCLAENGLDETVNASAYLNVQFPLSFITTPRDQTIEEGDEGTFLCKATGNPAPKIMWHKDGKTVATGDTLNFTVNRNQSGRYWCSAENGLGVKLNASALLDVQFPPSCSVRLTHQTVIEGNLATFHCDATGNPAPKITWMKDGMTVGQGDTLSFEANRTQSGYYWCSAQNTFNTTANASGYLEVHFKPERTHLSVDADITSAVKFDSSVKFNCTADSRPAVDEYRFYRDQSLLGSNNTGIYHLQLQRSGSYSCVAVNSAGSGQKATLYIAVKAWKPSFLGVGFGPFYLFKESQARLPCKPLGEPQPSVKWFKDGTAVSYGQNSSYKLEADGTLVITKVTDDDGGIYTCMAQNYLGKANATAPGILLERTKIVVKPQNRTVTKGTRVTLQCRATADPSLELRYIWRKDGADIAYESNVQLLEEDRVINIPDITAEEAGVYTCIVFTPDPKGSEDTASAIVSIQGAPPPPRDLQITDCYNRKTNLSWSPVVSNDTRVTHYLIDQESDHKSSVFKLAYNVTSPNITSVTLNLPGWATLRFRIRAVSSFGPSRPSIPTAEGICTTSVGFPEKYPANLRGVPVKANELSITWTPMPKEDWNAPGCYYILKYRKVNGILEDWIEEKIGDSKVGVFALSDPGYYQQWEFAINAGNHEGLGPVSPVNRSYSGQNPPAVKPENPQVGTVTDSNVTLFWEPVAVKQGSVDGYKIYYWGESLSVSIRRKRRDVPSSANSLKVLGGDTRQATLTGLKPYANYNVVVKAFNSAGEGPESVAMSFETLEGVPGPPSNVKIFPFGEYLLVTWTPPKEPNGIITNYQVGSAEYSALSPESVVVTMETVQPNVYKKLLGNERFETSYVVELRARTSKGWGASLRTTTTTMKKSAPAKPEKPTVVVTGEPAAFNVTYNFGVGGGWTHEFKVLYKKKGEGEQFQETAWVDHFRMQSTVIKDLDFAALYEIKTIGKNTVGTSPESNITEAFVAGDPVVGKAVGSPMYESDWFITLIIVSGCVFLLLVIVVLVKRHRRRRSLNFRVAEHEKEIENEKEKEKEIPARVDFKPREDWRGRLEEADRESHDSLDEYGRTDAHFTEDGSFVGEISIDKQEPSQEEVKHPVV
ncbi:hemicentin-1-like isoform X3 [Orbicella faveolata]|uniref:hemicentin-1-like isoform X3 n=1 Tax=Orbicella faveolata TaxID=48498 RepID=UPI0009E5E75D|nr:hemicentin-1-like isoform X3 [Orbicella faveolata]